ncbi:hypothetical protein AU191_08885 [Mycolicibacterium acapulense]|nr:hypothetical protein AU191_08885 [Mycolicibacterium acapulense]
MLAGAVEWASHNWPVFPLRGKVPAIPSAHPARVTFGNCADYLSITKDPLRGKCRGECSKLGHGLWDATCDLELVAWLWRKYPGANVGLRIPDPILAVDIDIVEAFDALLGSHGGWPECQMHISGRNAGGAHLFVRRPPGMLTRKRLPAGIDLKGEGGYVVGPPSVHPHSGRRYHYVDGPIPDPPPWFVELITAPHTRRHTTTRQCRRLTGRSIIESYNVGTPWREVLEPCGWECLEDDGDEDGARWRHPDATAAHSATISGGRLYVYSTSTDFEPTTAGEPHGYSRFDAYVVLCHGGDSKSAVAALRKGQVA